ncbi:MAG: sel1 repeat family protein [Campylobacter sp.]|nr:sel1 repeat family protein [Campylobacter sp.]
MKKVALCLFMLLSLAAASKFEEGLEAYQAGDYQKASKLYEQACDSKNAKSCFFLGDMYYYAQGVDQDSQKAFKYYKKACDGENAQGCFYLGALYEDGKVVEKELYTAKELYKKACDLGYNNGCYVYRHLNLLGY